MHYECSIDGSYLHFAVYDSVLSEAVFSSFCSSDCYSLSFHLKATDVEFPESRSESMECVWGVNLDFYDVQDSPSLINALLSALILLENYH